MKRTCKSLLSFLIITLLLFSAALPCISEEAPLTQTPMPQCSETGEHLFETYTFTGNSMHTASCVYCGEVFTLPCEYAQTPAYMPVGDGTHADACLLCGGKRIVPCSFLSTLTPPTQTEAGFTEYVCDICGYSYKDDLTPPEAERPESRQIGDVTNSDYITAEDARAVLRAAVNLDTLESDVLPYADTDADGDLTAADARITLRISVGLENTQRHDYSAQVEVAPDCVTAGSLTYRCIYCDQTGQMQIPALGHVFGEPVETPATCTQNGNSISTCTRCNYIKTSVLSPTGHILGEPAITPASCTQNGSIVQKCTRCDYTESTLLPATGHSFGDPVVTPATCTKEGKSVITCRACKTMITTVLAAKGHQWAQTNTAISCKVCSAAAVGWLSLDAQTYYCINGVKQKSWTNIGKDYYFFKRTNGRLAKNCTVDGLKLGANGKAVLTTYSQNKIKTLIKAKNIVAKITNPTDSLADKKLKCFRWVMKWPYKQYRLVGKSMKTKGWEMLFANDIFDHGNGCCGSTSCAFAFLAVEAGCSAVYVCDDGVSSGGHAWVTMEGNNKVYDVIFAKSKSFSANYNAYVKDYRRNPPRKSYIGG